MKSANSKGDVKSVKLPPLDKQKCSKFKRGDVVKVVMFNKDDKAAIEELKVVKTVRAGVRKTDGGDFQLWDVVLRPVCDITVNGKEEIVVPSNTGLASTEMQAVYNAFAGFRYESPEERLLKAVFNMEDGNEAKFRSLVHLANKIVTKTDGDFAEEQNAIRNYRKNGRSNGKGMCK